MPEELNLDAFYTVNCTCLVVFLDITNKIEWNAMIDMHLVSLYLAVGSG